MNHLRIKLLGGLLAGALAAPSMAVMTVTINDGPGSGPGGEFKLTPSGFPFTPASLTNGGFFESFCLEKNEYFNFGGTYTAVLNTEALGGGVGGQVGFGGDPLSAETQYLYWKFINGSLSSYDYGMGAGRVASANALQDVIWFLEDEHAKGWTDGDNSLQDLFYQDALANAGSGVNSVKVLNMYDTTTGQRVRAQDMLVAVVPVPGALVLGAMGMGLVGVMRRRLGVTTGG